MKIGIAGHLRAEFSLGLCVVIVAVEASAGELLFRIRASGKVGFIDSRGAVVIDPVASRNPSDAPS
jgi:hypothetical protein